jgi:hypothetical protein
MHVDLREYNAISHVTSAFDLPFPCGVALTWPTKSLCIDFYPDDNVIQIDTEVWNAQYPLNNSPDQPDELWIAPQALIEGINTAVGCPALISLVLDQQNQQLIINGTPAPLALQRLTRKHVIRLGCSLLYAIIDHASKHPMEQLLSPPCEHHDQ